MQYVAFLVDLLGECARMFVYRTVGSLNRCSEK